MKITEKFKHKYKNQIPKAFITLLFVILVVFLQKN